MSVPPSPDDILANETIVLGGVLATLETALRTMPGACLEIPTEAGELPWNALWLRLDYMKSRYRVTVTWDPSPDDPEPGSTP